MVIIRLGEWWAYVVSVPFKLKLTIAVALSTAFLSGVALYLSIHGNLANKNDLSHLAVLFTALILLLSTVSLVSSRKKKMFLLVLLGWLGYVWSIYPFMEVEVQLTYIRFALFHSIIGFLWLLYLFFDKETKLWFT